MNPAVLTAPRARRSADVGPAAATVDLWCASLDGQSPETVPWLQSLISGDEAERARRFYFERDRRRFVTGRGILRTLLGAYQDCAPQDVVIRYGPHGKPALVQPAARSPLAFNVAHSDGLALFAFTRAGEVGVDVERIRDLPDWEQIAGPCLPPREVDRLQSVPAEQRVAEFFAAWTRQEAMLKAAGLSAGGPPQRGTARRRPPARPEASPARAGLSYRAHALHPVSGFVAALAVPPAVRWYTCRSWSPATGGAPRLPAAQRRPFITLSRPDPLFS